MKIPDGYEIVTEWWERMTFRGMSFHEQGGPTLRGGRAHMNLCLCERLSTSKILWVLKCKWHKIVSSNEGDSLLTHYRHVKYVPQTGDNCGFAAIAMAATIGGKALDVDKLTDWAYDQELTEDGGLRDAHDLQYVCKYFLPCPSHIMKLPTESAMVHDLMDGYCFIVPYLPCQFSGDPVERKDKRFNGKCGHVALIFGVAMPLGRAAVTPNMKMVSETPRIYFGNPGGPKQTLAYREAQLLAMHGFSNGPKLWKYADLAKSIEGEVVRFKMS